MGIYRWFKIAKLVYKLGAAARSGLGPFYLCNLQVQRLMCKVLWEPWEPFATRHCDDCIAIAIGRHSSRSQQSKVCSSHSVYGHCLEWNLYSYVRYCEIKSTRRVQRSIKMWASAQRRYHSLPAPHHIREIMWNLFKCKQHQINWVRYGRR